MKDAFKQKIEVGSKVVYSVGGKPMGTYYVLGTVSKLHTKKPTSPDKVSITLIKTSDGTKFEREPVVNASNVIVIPMEI